MAILVKNPKTNEITELEVDETLQTDLGGGDTPETYTKRMAKEKGYTVLAEIVDPSSGEGYEIDEQELGAAEKKGYLYKPVYEAKQAQKQPNPVGKLEALGYGAAKFGTFGAAPAVGGLSELAKGGSYEKGRKAYEDRQNQAWEEQPGYYGTGAAAAIIPGIFSKGASIAAQGAVSAAPPLVEQATKEPTKEGWKQAGKEAAIGGALGLGLAKVGQVVAPKLAKSFQGVAERRAGKAIGADVLAPQRRIERLPGGGQKFGSDLIDEGIVQGTKTVPQMKEKAVALKELSGKAIGGTLDQFDKQIGKPVANPTELYNLMKKTTDELKQNPATVNLANRIETMFLGHFDDMMQTYQKAGVNEIPLKKIWEIRTKLDDLAFTPTGLDKPVNNVLKKFRKTMEDYVLAKAKANGIPEEQINKYIKDKRLYQVSSEAVDTSTQKVNRMKANRQISLTDYLSGGIGGTVGTAIAGPLGGVVGASLTMLGNKLLRERGPQASAVIMKKLADMQKTDPKRFGTILTNFVKNGQLIDFNEEQ